MKDMKVTEQTLWIRARKACIARDGTSCRICGKEGLSGHNLHVDHIYPIKTHPHLRFQLHNLQVLCMPCNMFKSSQDPFQFFENQQSKSFDSGIESFLSGLDKVTQPEPRLHHDVPPELLLYTEKQVAELLTMSNRTLQDWRVKGGGPKFMKIGSSVRYRKSDLLEWLKKRERRNTIDPGDK
jgi:excisionase family DNA binding protein